MSHQALGAHYLCVQGPRQPDKLDALVTRYLRDRDEAAGEELVKRTRPRLLAAARRIGSSSDAEDAVQTAYLSLLHKQGAALDAPVMPWLVRAVVRIAYRHKAQREKQRELANKLATIVESPSPGDRAADAEEREALRGMIDRLPAKYRDVVVLHYLEGLTPNETAHLVGATPAAVRKRLERARSLLRSRWMRAGSILVFPWWQLRDSAGATATATAAIGGVLMQNKSIAAIALVLVVLLGGIATWRAQRGEDSLRTVAQSRSTAESHVKEPQPRAVVDTRPSVSGLVCEEDGTPVPGATVIYAPTTMEGSIDPEKVKEPARTTKTDATGRFALRIDEACPKHLVYVAKRGFCPQLEEDARSDAPLEIVLEPAATLNGRVISFEEKPVAGARIRWQGLLGGVRYERECVSGADGRFRLEDVPSREGFERFSFARAAWVEVRADGYAPLFVSRGAVPSGPDHSIELVLIGGATVRGTARHGETGQPLAQTRVVLWSSEATAVGYFRPGLARVDNPFAPRALAETTTDKHGAFSFEHVPAQGFHLPEHGGYSTKGPIVGWVAALAPGLVPIADSIAYPLDGATIEVEPKCWPGATVTGRVIDEGGEGLEGVAIYAFAQDRPSAGFTRLYPETAQKSLKTDADGRYRIEGLPALRNTASIGVVSARLEKYPPMVWMGVQVKAEMRAGKVTEFPDLVLAEPGIAAVDVEVIDEDGRPVWDASARFGQVSPGPHTDANGRVRIYQHARHGAGLGPHRIYVIKKGYAPAFSDVVVPHKTQPPLVQVTLKHGHRLNGTVLWEDGTPVRRAMVTAFNGTMPDAFVEMDAWSNAPESKGLPALAMFGRVWTDATGNFEFDALPEGPYHLRVVGMNANSLEVSRPPVARFDGVQTGAKDLRFEIPGQPSNASGEVLVGRVEDSQTGRALYPASARLMGSGRVFFAKFPSLGRFRFENIPAGDWTLSVSSGSYSPQETIPVTIKAGVPAKPLRVALVRGTDVSGRVSGVDDLAGVTLAFTSEFGDWSNRSTIDPSGRYHIPTMPPGRYRPVLYVPEGKAAIALRAPSVLVVTEGEKDIGFDIPVAPAGRIELKIVQLRPVIYRDGSVTITDTDAKVVFHMIGAKALAARRPAFPPGRYRVLLRYLGQEPQTRDVDVIVGQTVSARFELP
ncbi:MAG: sigma-70 family RNA polymerase sigma factor [Planctomycetota bacterium]